MLSIKFKLRIENAETFMQFKAHLLPSVEVPVPSSPAPAPAPAVPIVAPASSGGHHISFPRLVGAICSFCNEMGHHSCHFCHSQESKTYFICCSLYFLCSVALFVRVFSCFCLPESDAALKSENGRLLWWWAADSWRKETLADWLHLPLSFQTPSLHWSRKWNR